MPPTTRVTVAAVVATLVASAALVASLLAKRRAGGGHDERPPEPTTTVRCPDCGATNAPGYRYCRACLGDRPDDSLGGHDDRAAVVGAPGPPLL